MIKAMLSLTAAAVSALLGLAAVAPTLAAPPVRNEATVISHVTIDKDDPSIGYVRARYTCQPSTEPAHLWVSVKQMADGSADPALTEEGTGFGGVADIWLQSHPTTVQCDGKPHVQVFEVNTLESLPPEEGGGAVGHGELVRGSAYVQFCLFTGDGDFISDMNFQSVK
jgi:hypothetical protein